MEVYENANLGVPSNENVMIGSTTRLNATPTNILVARSLLFFFNDTTRDTKTRYTFL